MRDALACEKRTDRRCMVSTVMVNHWPAATEHVGLAVAMLRHAYGLGVDRG